MLPRIDQSLGLLAGAKWFSKIDLNLGFWQTRLSDESKLLTTFITPFGRFAFNRLVMGLCSSSEYFQKRMTQLVESIEGVLCQTDDILVFGRTQAEHDERLHEVLTRLHEANLTINRSKTEFRKTSIKYVGHIIGPSGISADPERVQGIKNLEAPTDVHGVRRLLGMVNQLGKFSPLLAEHSKPIRDLLSSKNQFYWGPDQQKAFDLIKQSLTNAPVLALYDPNRYTVLKTDASSYGLGCALFQKQDDGDMKPVSFASRALSPTEQRYSTIEKEALGVTYGCEKNRDFLIGKTFHIETDHQPLISLLGGHKDLSDLPLRIMRFRMRLMPFSYTISHVAGKSLIIPDMLSRNPVVHSLTLEEEQHSSDTENYVDMVIRHLPATDLRLQEIREKQSQDVICQTLANYCNNGWPETKHKASEIGKVYWHLRGELTINKGLLMKAGRLFIPTEMRADILTKIHGVHQGITKCKLRARESVWWLDINSDIEKEVKSCDVCAKLQNDHAEPMISTKFDDRPWKHLGSDLFFWKGHTYLLVVCYYSRFIELAKLRSLTTEEVITHLKSMFSRHGVCDIFTSDNGGCYSGQAMQKFMKEYGIKHITSSPRYPLGNSEAERAVQTCKRLLEKSDDPYIALMHYRATPLSNGYSPSQLLYSRQIKTILPQNPDRLKPKVINQTSLLKKENAARAYSKMNYDVRHRARNMTPLRAGDNVHVKSFNVDGKVLKAADRPRSYVVDTPRGEISRNRRHLVRLNKEVELNDPTDLQPMVHVQERKVQGDSANSHNSAITESDTLLSNSSGPEQLSSVPLHVSQETSNKPYVVTRSGRISKPPERLQYN